MNIVRAAGPRELVRVDALLRADLGEHRRFERVCGHLKSVTTQPSDALGSTSAAPLSRISALRDCDGVVKTKSDHQLRPSVSR
jgi:hypothetical protein